MPRPRKYPQASTSSGTPLSSGQASYVLDRLISERRVSQTDINRYVSDLGREITDLESRLQRLREAHGGKIAAAGAAIAGAAAAGAAVIRRGRKPGRKPGRPGRPPGRPPGSGAAAAAPGVKRRPGRPPRAAAPAEQTAAAPAATKGGAKRGRRPSAISAGQLASRQLQGRYLALVRQFPENRRAQFAKTAKEKGRETAIKEMQDSLKK